MIAIIPAHGGSKGIVNKNLQCVGNVPLVGRAIKTALQCKYIDRIIVSTDKEAISLVSQSFGADVIDRPKELCKDDSSSESALLYVLHKIKYKENAFVFLQCTSPFTTSDDLNQAIELFNRQINLDCLFSVTKWYGFLWAWDYCNLIGLTHGSKWPRPTRQEQEGIYFKETGAFYIIRTERFLEHKDRLSGTIDTYNMPPNRSIDIDTQDDLDYANFLCEKYKL